MKKTELIGTVCEARAYDLDDVGGAGLTIERAPIGGPARVGRENVHINGLVSHMVHGFRIVARVRVTIEEVD